MAERHVYSAITFLSAGCQRDGNLLIGLLLIVSPTASGAEDSTSRAWAALAQGGHVALIRDALADVADSIR